jgi:tRNA threonylcarbamoyladenosine biosynthesis protein TsaE
LIVHPEPIPPRAGRGHLSVSLEELVDWGGRLGHALVPPTVITMSGELGTGKTTLTQAICRGYGVTSEVTSPTFTIVHEYEGSRSLVHHLDLYRVRTSAELENVGWDDILRERGLVIVEWPDRAAALMPAGHIPISLAYLPDRPDRRLLYAGGHT